MSRPSTSGRRILRPRTVAAFIVGTGIGLILVAPALPDSFGSMFTNLFAGGAGVILVGVAALAVLMVFIAIAYRLYL